MEIPSKSPLTKVEGSITFSIWLLIKAPGEISVTPSGISKVPFIFWEWKAPYPIFLRVLGKVTLSIYSSSGVCLVLVKATSSIISIPSGITTWWFFLSFSFPLAVNPLIEILCVPWGVWISTLPPKVFPLFVVKKSSFSQVISSDEFLSLSALFSAKMFLLFSSSLVKGLVSFSWPVVRLFSDSVFNFLSLPTVSAWTSVAWDRDIPQDKNPTTPTATTAETRCCPNLRKL